MHAKEMVTNYICIRILNPTYPTVLFYTSAL